ncbi:MAG: elongation factor G [FCB group bacterium]|nr:elongation factor G [FCB group bacterium]
MANVDPGNVRNAGIVGHGGVGKTTLIEHILHAVGKTNRIGKVQEGNTAGDYLQEEIARQHSITMKLFHFDWKNKRIHLVDHPGLPDFVGEMASSTSMLDGLIIVVDASTGPQLGTDNAFKYADLYGTPRAIFVNKLDRDNTSFSDTVDAIQAAYGPQCVPVVAPIGSGMGLTGVASIFDAEVPDEVKDEIEALKGSMVDAVAEADDALLEKYLEAGELSPEEFSTGLMKGISASKVVPILGGSADKDVGIAQLLDFITNAFPSPLDRKIVAHDYQDKESTVQASADAPFLAQVFRTVVDPYVGQLTLFRVLTGTLRSDSEFLNTTTSAKERTGKLYLMNGKEQTAVEQVVPGDLAAMTKLKNTHFGDTLSAPGGVLQVAKIALPESMVKLAIVPKSRADEDKIGEALNRLAEEDPTFTHFRDPATHEHVIKGMGDQQLEILLDRMKNKFHVEAETKTPKVAYKETIKGIAEAQGKHKKQTGGHGQYGDVHLRLKPNERGAGYLFVDSVVGGVVPKNFIPAVDKGAVETLERGIMAGYPVVDIIVELFYGSYHDVDSSEMAFKLAASLALNKGVKDAKPVLLEPISIIEVTLPEEYLGDINGDLNSRRGRILGMEAVSGGRQVIRAQVPEAEVLRYSTDLRSMTGGRGTFTMKFSHYDEVPEHIAQQLIAAYQKERAAAE